MTWLMLGFESTVVKKRPLHLMERKFRLLVEKDLEELEFSQRQELLAKSIKDCLPLSYEDSLKVLRKFWVPSWRVV